MDTSDSMIALIEAAAEASPIQIYNPQRFSQDSNDGLEGTEGKGKDGSYQGLCSEVQGSIDLNVRSSVSQDISCTSTSACDAEVPLIHSIAPPDEVELSAAMTPKGKQGGSSSSSSSNDSTRPCAKHILISAYPSQESSNNMVVTPSPKTPSDKENLASRRSLRSISLGRRSTLPPNAMNESEESESIFTSGAVKTKEVTVSIVLTNLEDDIPVEETYRNLVALTSSPSPSEEDDVCEPISLKLPWMDDKEDGTLVKEESRNEKRLLKRRGEVLRPEPVQQVGGFREVEVSFSIRTGRGAAEMGDGLVALVPTSLPKEEEEKEDDSNNEVVSRSRRSKRVRTTQTSHEPKRTKRSSSPSPKTITSKTSSSSKPTKPAATTKGTKTKAPAKKNGDLVYPVKTAATFSQQVFQMVTETAKSHPEIISWVGNTGAFHIHQTSGTALSKILQKYFNHSNYASLQRQLNMYGFSKVKNGEFAHEHFPRYIRNWSELDGVVRRPPPPLTVERTKAKNQTRVHQRRERKNEQKVAQQSPKGGKKGSSKGSNNVVTPKKATKASGKKKMVKREETEVADDTSISVTRERRYQKKASLAKGKSTKSSYTPSPSKRRSTVTTSTSSTIPTSSPASARPKRQRNTTQALFSDYEVPSAKKIKEENSEGVTTTQRTTRRSKRYDDEENSVSSNDIPNNAPDDEFDAGRMAERLELEMGVNEDDKDEESAVSLNLNVSTKVNAAIGMEIPFTNQSLDDESWSPLKGSIKREEDATQGNRAKRNSSFVSSMSRRSSFVPIQSEVGSTAPSASTELPSFVDYSRRSSVASSMYDSRQHRNNGNRHSFASISIDPRFINKKRHSLAETVSRSSFASKGSITTAAAMNQVDKMYSQGAFESISPFTSTGKSVEGMTIMAQPEPSASSSIMKQPLLLPEDRESMKQYKPDQLEPSPSRNLVLNGTDDNSGAASIQNPSSSCVDSQLQLELLNQSFSRKVQHPIDRPSMKGNDRIASSVANVEANVASATDKSTIASLPSTDTATSVAKITTEEIKKNEEETLEEKELSTIEILSRRMSPVMSPADLMCNESLD